ncbi:MAG: hypothetical protein R3C03_01085 [Pirellulaceae bacterium]
MNVHSSDSEHHSETDDKTSSIDMPASASDEELAHVELVTDAEPAKADSLSDEEEIPVAELANDNLENNHVANPGTFAWLKGNNAEFEQSRFANIGLSATSMFLGFWALLCIWFSNLAIVVALFAIIFGLLGLQSLRPRWSFLGILLGASSLFLLAGFSIANLSNTESSTTIKELPEDVMNDEWGDNGMSIE